VCKGNNLFYFCKIIQKIERIFFVRIRGNIKLNESQLNNGRIY